MPRPRRIEYPNAYYHVMNRGVAKNAIFFNDKSYEIFLEILGESCKKFGVTVHAYCLMTNHYHLLLQTPNANLSSFMQHLGCHYAKRYNNFMQTDGPLFKGRFKSIVVEKDSYLLTLSRYIHRNPMAFVKNLKSYKWSSYPAYLKLLECQPWLNKDEVLHMLSMDEDPISYENFVEKNWPSEETVPGTMVPGTF